MTDNATPSTDPKLPPILPARWLRLLGAVAVGIAIVGFLVGVGAEPVIEARRHEPGSTGDPHHDDVELPSVAGYDALVTADLGRNAEWSPSLADLRFDRPGRFDAVTRTPEMTRVALADRSRWRAFDGAPPVVPHPITQQSAASCLACHGEGVKVGDRIATKVSHPHFTSCTQCHVESISGNPATDEPLTSNEFAGRERSGPGLRAMTGSPPTIPHTTWLRQDCLSCHGLIARPGLRTTHPWQSNCMQCHAPSAELDQLPFARDPGTFP